MNRARVVGEMPSNMRTASRSGPRSQLRKVPRVFACNRRVYDTANRRRTMASSRGLLRSVIGHPPNEPP